MHKGSRLLSSALLAGATIPIVAAAAGAAPLNAPKSATISLDCGTAGTFLVVVNSGSANVQTFSPAHFLDNSSVLVPTNFGVFTGTITTTTIVNGSPVVVVQTVTGPAVTKGQGTTPANATTVTCGYSFTFTSPDGSVVFVGSGTVTGFLPGSQH
ncbi:MAG: hypothetical protein NVS3B21_28810 [Acidimicrobiales bacterium]